MSNDKKKINAQLFAIRNNPTFSDPVAKSAVKVAEKSFASDATVFGKGSGIVNSGITSYENKIDGAGTTRGDTVVGLTSATTGLSGFEDPSKMMLPLSKQTFGEETTTFSIPESQIVITGDGVSFNEGQYTGTEEMTFYLKVDSADTEIDPLMVLGDTVKWWTSVQGSEAAPIAIFPLPAVDTSKTLSDGIIVTFESNQNDSGTAWQGVQNFTEVFSRTDVTASGGNTSTSVKDLVGSITGLTVGKQNIEGDVISGSSIKAINETIKEDTKKKNTLKDSISAVAGSVSSGSALSNLQTNAQGSIDDLAKEISSIPAVNSAAALMDTVQDATSSITETATNTFNDISTGFTDIVNEVKNDIESAVSGFEAAVGQLGNYVEDVAIKTGSGLVQDIAESLSRQASSALKKFTNGFDFTDAQTSVILQKIQSNDQAEVADGLRQIAANSKSNSVDMKSVLDSIKNPTNTSSFIQEVQVKAEAKGISDKEIKSTIQRITAIEDDLSELTTTISGTLVKSSQDFYTEDTNLKDNLIRYKGALSDFSAFTYVDSKEELGAEVRSIIRDVSEVIVHATETFTDQNIGCEEIHVDHNERKLNGIQYHYVIRRDGRLQRGLPVDKQSDASNIKTHSIYSIDIALVGGINASTGTDNPLEYTSSQSFTIAQMKTLEAFLEAFYRRYPGGQVMGHNALEEEAQDPYFDVVAYADTLFRKKSVYKDLLTDVPQTSKTLVTKRPV